MSRINQPKNQIRLTNVSIVRLRDGPNTFELACYPNKVKDWRQGKETDLSEVLQSDKIFSCVGKGQFARDAELIGSFGTSDFYACVKQILAQGTIQLSTRERMVQQQQFQKEVYVLTAPRLLPLKATLALSAETVESCAKKIGCVPKTKKHLPPKAYASRLAEKLARAFPEDLGIVATKISLHTPHAKQTTTELLEPIGAFAIQQNDNNLVFCVAPSDLAAVETYAHNKQCPFIVLDKRTAIPIHELRNKPHEPSSEEEPSSESESSESEEDDSDETPAPVFKDSTKQTFTTFGALEASDSEDDESLSPEDMANPNSQDVQNEHKKTDSASAAIDEEEEEGEDDVDLEQFLDRRAAVHHERTRAKKLLSRQRKEKEKSKKAAAEALAEVVEPPTEPKPRTPNEPTSATWCRTCEIDYLQDLNLTIQKHMRSEWHVFNMKRAVRGEPPVSQEVFNDLSRDVKEGFLAVES